MLWLCVFGLLIWGTTDAAATLADHTPLIVGVAIGGVVLLLAVIGSIMLFSMITRGKFLCCFGKLSRSTSKKAGTFDQPMSLEPTRSAKGNTLSNDLEQQNRATVVGEGAKQKIKEKPEVKVKPFDPNENPSGSNVVDSDTKYYNTMMLSTKVRKEHLRDYIDAAEQKQELGKQYRRLTKGKAHPWKAAEENMAKNRYKGILAYDHTRVVLERDCTDDSDYINANYIPGFGREKAFIAAQGAIEQNINDYWRMIWQEQVSTIVIVTKLEENRKMKSLQYWPNKNQHMTYGSVYVTLLEESTHFQYVTRKLRAIKGAEERIVSQFHFLGWPDHGVPESPTTLVNFWHVVRSHTQQEQDNDPVLVHCSAGIGRTGTYISLDYLLDEAAAGDHVDILACVNKLRTHRMDMVQTVSQYKFLYHAVYEGIYVANTLLDTNHFRNEHHLQNTRIEQQLKVLDEQKPFSADVDAADERGDEDSDWDIQVFKVQGQGPRAMEIKHPKGSNLIFSEPPVTASQHFWNMLQVYRTATVLMPKSKAKRSAWLPGAGKPLELPYGVSVRLQSSSDRTHIVIQQGPVQPVTSAPSEESGVYMNVGEHAAEEFAYMNTEEARKEAASEPVQTSQIQLITMETADADAIVNAWKRMEREKNHVIVSRDRGGDLGLFAVSCVLLDVMAEFGQVDVFSTVRQLRPHFIPDQTQYRALHNVLSYYCQHEGNSSNCEP